jgi:MoaA/NifB/PqqE/SkfB family radical SAM enzyme
MQSQGFKFRRDKRALNRRFREWRMLAKGVLSTDHPVMAHIIPIRRCNLACTYCNEYDDFSKPVPQETMFERLDQLADLGTTIITFSGGEPLLHPDLDRLIEHVRSRGIIAGLITNGYLLTPQRVNQLNDAGLDHLQISIDNVMPDDVSKKSLKVLDKKLQILADYALFHVNINSVLGGGIHNPEDALVVGKRATELGFTSTVGIIHDHEGQLRPIADRERERRAERLAVSRRRTLSVHLRRRARPLLLPAARLPSQAFSRLHARRHPPRIPDAEKLRPVLHGLVRPPDRLLRLLARSPNHRGHADARGRGAPGPDRAVAS